MGNSDRFWSALDRFRTSKSGVALFYAYLVGILIGGGVVAYAVTNNHALAAQANAAALKANRALCFEKQAAHGQLVGARKFLREHPNGTPDFSRALILNAIHDDEANFRALRDVECRRSSPLAPAGG